MVEKIGDYNILKKIGAGGMAQVYLAVHQDVPNLKVVLKVLSDQRLVERFKQEADKLALLDGHGHICQIKHFFNHGDEIVIAMEYIDGSTLEDMVKNEGKLPPETAVQITISVLDTLFFAHEKNIYHRDIKPGNIMIDKRGHVKIIDFGIAKGDSDPNLTIAGSSCGTPAYMPPEQFNPTENINYALADIYAIGTTLYYMLTGDLPFKADNAFALRDAKLFNEPISPKSLNPNIPDPLEKIILTSISRDPEDRYASVEAMKQALQNLGLAEKNTDLTQHVVPAHSDTPTPAPPSKKSSSGGSKKLPIIIGAAAVVIIAIALFFILGRETKIEIAAPTLLSPANGDTLTSAIPRLEWQGAPNNFYRLEIASDTLFAAPQIVPKLSITSFQPGVEMDDGDYYWRVQASDRSGNQGPYSAIATFVIAAEPQDTGAALATGQIEIRVAPAGDIFIDGRSYGEDKQKLSVKLNEGTHIIRIENGSSIQKRYTDTVMVSAIAPISVARTFTFPETPPGKEYGDLRIGSKPYIGAVIFIDGVLQDRRTNNTFRVETGRRIIKGVLTMEGVEHEKTDTVVVTKTGSNKLIFDFEN